MLIEQIIEFELRSLGPMISFTLTNDCFQDKTKISKKSLRVVYYLLLRYCSPMWAKSFNKI